MTTASPTSRAELASFVPVILCCLAAVCEGFDLQAPGVTAPVLRTVFGLTPQQTGLFVSMSTFGMMLGALLGGGLSDRIGRKWVLVGSIATFSALSVITAFSTSAEMLFWTRFATGIGLGGALPNLVAISVESVAQERRSTAVGLMLAGPPVGGALASLLAATAANPDQWTLIYYAGGIVPLVLVVPLLVAFLPNRRPAADVDPGRTSPSNVVAVLFGEQRAFRTVAVWLGLFSILLVLFVLLGWLPTLMVDRGLARSQASLVQMIFNLSSIPGSVLSGLALDFVLRRRMFSVLGAVFVAAIGSVLLLAYGPANLGAMLVAGALAGITVIGGQTAIYALAPRCYPRSGRGTGMGFGVAIGRFGSAGGPLFTGYLVALGLTSTQVLMTLLPIGALAGVAALFIAASLRDVAQELT